VALNLLPDALISISVRATIQPAMENHDTRTSPSRLPVFDQGRKWRTASRNWPGLDDIETGMFSVSLDLENTGEKVSFTRLHTHIFSFRALSPQHLAVAAP
jgi:hypothetical protein